MKTAKCMDPAIIIVAFGSTRRGTIAFELLDKKVKEQYRNHDVFWAYTSAFIRRKTGMPSLGQVLASIESRGFGKAVVLPLHIFPGSEYNDVAETVENFSGLDIQVGESLLHNHLFIKDVLSVVEKDFLPAGEGLNLLALHGTTITSESARNAYLGVEKFVNERYDHAFAASLEGTPRYEEVLHQLTQLRKSGSQMPVRIIPMMYLAGLHVEDDLMGETNSWKSSLTEKGFDVDCLRVVYDGETFYKSLAFYSQIRDHFLDRLARALGRLHH